MLIDLCISTSDSLKVLPSSRQRVGASASFCFSMSAAARASIFPRAGAGVSRQAGNAAFAAAIASRTSPRVERGATLVTSCRFAGLRRSRVCPETDSTQRPLMKLRHSGAVTVAVLIGVASICGLRQARCPGPNDLVVTLRSAVTIELPRRPDILDFVEIKIRHNQLVLVATALRHDLSARIAEITLAVKFADAPGFFCSDSIDRRDEILIGHCVRRLLQFPQVLRQAGNCRGRIENDLRSVQTQYPRALGEMAVVADVYANLSEACLEYRIPRVSRREIEFLPETRMAVRDVVFAVFTEVASIGVEPRCGVVKHPRHLDLVNRNDQHHLIFLGQLLHARKRRPLGDALGQLVPPGILLGTKVWPVEKLLQAEGLTAFLRRGRDHLFVLRDHLLFDVHQ